VTIDPKIALRLQFMVRVVRKECQHLVSTDQRLFSVPFTLERARHACPGTADVIMAIMAR
jgi:DNA polymerase II large subunit